MLAYEIFLFLQLKPKKKKKGTTLNLSFHQFSPCANVNLHQPSPTAVPLNAPYGTVSLAADGALRCPTAKDRWSNGATVKIILG